MKMFGSGIVGCTFKRGRTIFMVMDIEPYPEERIKPQFKDRLMRLKSGKLVAVTYRGTLIPNITLRGGVVRLTRIAIDGEVLSGPRAISKALGINTAHYPYTLRRVK
jgi:hypothetical protein